MFGSLGWGLAMFFVGMALDHATTFPAHPCGVSHPAEKNYTVCFAVFSVLMSCAFLTALQFRYDFHGPGRDIALSELTEKVKDKVRTVAAEGGRGGGVEDERQGVGGGVCLLVGCLTSQQHASVSQGRICSDNLTCCHTEIEVADQTFHLTQSQYTDTGPTSPSTDPITPGDWQGSLWSVNF